MKIVRLFNDIRIKRKISLTFITVAVIPLLVCGIFFTGKLREIMVENAMKQAEDNVDRVRKRTAEIINVPLDVSYQLSNDTRMKSIANHRYDSYIEVIQTYREYTDIRDYVRLYKEVGAIRLYTQNPTMLNNWEFMQPSDETIQADWYQTALAKKGLVGWGIIQDERDQKDYLSLVRRINLDVPGKDSVLVINVNTELLDSVLSQESFPTAIVDDHNRIVAANHSKLYDSDFSEIYSAANTLTQNVGSFDAIVDGKASKVVIADLVPANSWNGLRVISVFSESAIFREVNGVIRYAALVIGICLFVAVMLVQASATLITSRLLRLSRHMSKVGTGSWTVYPDLDGKDEIGQLSQRFNALVGRLSQLMKEMDEANRQKRKLEQRQSEIKLKMLASQINPHFLFNTLESIRMEAHLRGEEEIAHAIWQLSALIRNGLEVDNGKISLSRELDMVKCYLELQKFRYEDRLNYKLEVEPGIEEIEIPPLIIQPLVENSILHGLEQKEEGATTILIRAYFDDNGRVCVNIFDDGAGIAPKRLQELNRMLNEPEEEAGQRIGLRNVHDRLKLIYGDGAGLTIGSQEGEGTQISFCIPKEGGVYVHCDDH